ncbi:unnamed protein product [Strongylus vulgaris]|uniref:Uncharacterized protein n=1 Tax=Strongylus vulgaris TaxID=40348 RepID=A0A3P7ICU0_STRVU|nr:unnamed protein product [Strongylus vulgaris]
MQKVLSNQLLVSYIPCVSSFEKDLKKAGPQGPLRFGKRRDGPSGPLRFGKRSLSNSNPIAQQPYYYLL